MTVGDFIAAMLGIGGICVVLAGIWLGGIALWDTIRRK